MWSVRPFPSLWTNGLFPRTCWGPDTSTCILWHQWGSCLWGFNEGLDSVKQSLCRVTDVPGPSRAILPSCLWNYTLFLPTARLEQVFPCFEFELFPKIFSLFALGSPAGPKVNFITLGALVASSRHIYVYIYILYTLNQITPNRLPLKCCKKYFNIKQQHSLITKILKAGGFWK